MDLFTLPEIRAQCLRVRYKFTMVSSIRAHLVVAGGRVWFLVVDWHAEYIRRSALWVNHDGYRLSVWINLSDIDYSSDNFVKVTIKKHISTLGLSAASVPKPFRFAMKRNQPRKKG